MTHACRPGALCLRVVLPAFIGIVVVSALAAPLGARLAHRLPETTLRRIFALFVAILGVRMLWALLL